MKTRYLVLGILFQFGFSFPSLGFGPEELRDLARHSIDFFKPTSSCPLHLTHLNWDGTPVIEGGIPRADRHIVATSRMIYGLVKTADLVEATDPTAAKAYLDRAVDYANFILTRSVKRDAEGAYFVAAVDETGVILDPHSGAPASQNNDSTLLVEQQAYGLSGLVALYLKRKDPHLLAAIQEIYRGFYFRFHDPVHGAFFDSYDRVNHGPSVHPQLKIRPKSFNSTAYVASAFLFEMASSTDFNSAQGAYPPPTSTLEEVGAIMARNFWDPKTGWIFENWSEDWRVVWHGWQGQPEGSVASVGHNFQAAWLMLQMAEKFDPKSSLGKELFETASQILKRQLTLPGIDREYGGFYNTILRETGEPIWACTDDTGPNSGKSYKHWWQQVFGILALELGSKLGVFDPAEQASVRTILDKSIRFYRDHFIDRIYGGEFFVVKRDGAPVYSGGEGRKGAAGKSAHHSLQLYWYLNQYLHSSHYAPRRFEGPTDPQERKKWYFEPASRVDWYPGKHIGGYLGGSPRRADYPEIFGPAPEGSADVSSRWR